MASGLRRTLFAREVPRAAGEFASFLRARRGLLKAPPGDGRPVMVMPGFIGSDGSTLALRRLLRALGYHVHAWRLGRNWGPTDYVLDGLRERVQALLQAHREPLTLIGHSLGGVYAREIARAAPVAVRQVITLGSPVRRPDGRRTAVEPLFQVLSPLHSERVKDVDPAGILEPLPVPLTAIVTRSDGVVPWSVCIPNRSERTEVIVVKGSHSGLIHNPAAIGVILDRLSLDEWEPYRERDELAARVWVEDEAR